MITITDLSLEGDNPDISNLSLQVENGETYILLSKGSRVSTQFFNLFSGISGVNKGSIKLDGQDIYSNPVYRQQNFSFIHNIHEFPVGMKLNDFISFFKKVMDITDEQLEDIYLKLDAADLKKKKMSELEEIVKRELFFSFNRLRNSKNTIIHDLAKGMPLDFILEFKESIQDMKNEGHSILYLSDDVFFAPEIGDRIGFMKKGRLLLELKAAKMRKMDLKDLYFQFLSEE